MRRRRWCQEGKDAVDTVKTISGKTNKPALIVLSILYIFPQKRKSAVPFEIQCQFT